MWITRKVRWVVVSFLAVILLGAAGYRAIEGWSWLDSVWMAVITLTTIGFGEVHPLSTAGRWFTLALIVGGLGVYSFGFTTLTRYVFGGDMAQELAERRKRRRMHRVHDHFLVVGYGRLGREVAMDLQHAGRDVVVIDDDPEVGQRAERDGFATIVGDATLDAVLGEAHLERAKGVAVATASNAINILVTLSAHELAPSVRIWTRVDSDEAAIKARRAGASGVLSPHGLGGTYMALGLLRPQAHSFLELATVRSVTDLAFEDVAVGPGHCGPLRELAARERHQILVVAIRKPDGSMLTVPGPEVVIEPGDVAVAVGQPAHLQQFARAVR